jgi:hypothetical protein
MLGFALPTGMGEVEEFMAVTVHNGITVIIGYKENTRGLRRGMNPTTLTHPPIDSTFGYSTVPNPEILPTKQL